MYPPLQLKHFLVTLLILPLAACTFGSRKQAATPPPPKPAAVQPPAPEPQLSIPQTAVVLPSPQPVNPDAIPAPPAQVQAPEQAETPPPAARAAHHTNPPKPESETEPEAPAAPAAPAVQQQAPIQPILSGSEQKQLQDAIETRKHEIEERINRAKRHLTSHDRSLIERINSFLLQSAEAEKLGEYAQADALSQRAAILARELQGE